MSVLNRKRSPQVSRELARPAARRGRRLMAQAVAKISGETRDRVV